MWMGGVVAGCAETSRSAGAAGPKTTGPTGSTGVRRLPGLKAMVRVTPSFEAACTATTGRVAMRYLSTNHTHSYPRTNPGSCPVTW